MPYDDNGNEYDDDVDDDDDDDDDEEEEEDDYWALNNQNNQTRQKTPEYNFLEEFHVKNLGDRRLKCFPFIFSYFFVKILHFPKKFCKDFR